MIAQLYIRNFALISELQIDFPKGFSTITGETGAGKSIILGALSLALGDRADNKTLKNPEEKAVIELSIHLEAATFKALFEDVGLEFEPETILRREILPTGKTRAFVNDVPVRLEAVQQISGRLADIHSQHDTMLLKDFQFQLFLIDRLAANQPIRVNYQEAFGHWQMLLREKKQLQTADLGVGGDYDYLSFLDEELNQAQLKRDEEGQLEQEIEKLSNAEEIQKSLAIAYGLLQENEPNSISLLQHIASELRVASRFDAAAASLLARVDSVIIELKDLALELANRGDAEWDLSQLEQLNARYSQLQHLFNKHKVQSSAELMQKHDAIAEQLEAAASRANRIAEIDAEISSAFENAQSLALALTESRQAVVPELEQQINDLLKDLNMPDAKFAVDLRQQEDNLSPSGQDQVQLMFQANPGFAAMPLYKVASGGELSRVMLALKAVLSATHGLPTIIFDEIDTGISGETAGKVARILQRMGKTMQVLAITHLPQIAAAGAHQFKVYKMHGDGTTTTHLEPIPQADRIDEIARLLGGEQLTQAAKEHAGELLKEFEG
jgi:DNA repair protein RecN (Recombination protein N)